MQIPSKIFSIFLLLLSVEFFSCIPGTKFDISKRNLEPVFIPQIDGAADKKNRYEISGNEFVISTDHPLASRAGIEAWKAGGNVVDAFVSASFAVSIVRPQSTGLLGGGFAIVHFPGKKIRKAFDFRERSPKNGKAELYVDKDGKPIPGKTLNGPYAAGVPGMIQGLVLIQKKYGKLPLEKVIESAIGYARQGFPIYSDLARSIESNWKHMNPEMQFIFGKENRPLREGETLVQEDLAKVLERIQTNGDSEIRKGITAEKMAAYYSQFENYMDANDLETYQVYESEPISGTAFGKTLLTMPPPSSGVHLITILQTWNELNQKKSLPTGEIGKTINLTEAMRVGYKDRSDFGGDPRFTNVDVSKFISDEYAKSEANEIERKIVSGAWSNVSGNLKSESYNTTHISILDKEGNAVSSTQSVNGILGAKVVVPGTGLILNNTMDDFSVAPGVPNLYKLIGSEANKIAPGKTPLSSMSPSILLDEKGKSEIVIGAPGGSQIPTTIINTLIRYKKDGYSLYESASYPRLHHQFQPDVLFVEPELKSVFPEANLPFYKVQYIRHRAKVFAVAREGDKLIGVSDPRGEGIPLGF
ncbi:gamma-glutamyltransferase [Leptospira ilyithenensis]|uniref:Glutathione hydrolase proenzyme n=1 Tax=Leptospira ilyithenensis TaxID=2484901 RepID=A0A4R9LKM4_9LEPT|nr:gamma-glutamyltransferase [Leptospira ilyithenensis]TGN08135.1 gamma-glutamyltransferase [Leptospira ilyithenensis]